MTESKREPEYTPEQMEKWMQDGTVPVPQSTQGKLIDALARCLWLLEAPGVKTSKAMKGYQVDYVIRLGKAALTAAGNLKNLDDNSKAGE